MTAAPARRIVTLTPASDIRIERKQELWKSQIMLAVPHLMAGMGGVGKSTFTCHIAAQVTRGTLEGDLFGKPANVMIINTEDSPAMVKARMIAAGADIDRVFIVSTRFCDESGNLTETTPKLRQDVDQLEAAMVEYQVKLLVADPFATVIEGDTNTGMDVRATIDPMIRLAHNTGATVLIVSHFNKGAGTASNKISGSHAIRDAVRGAHVFAKDEDEGVTVVTLDKNNYSQEVGKSQAFRLETHTVPTDDGEAMEVPVVVMMGETTTSVTDLINRNIVGGEDREDRDAVELHIYEYLFDCGGSAEAKDVIRSGLAQGFKETDLKKARNRMRDPKISTQRLGFGKSGKYVWAIDSPMDSMHSIDSTPTGAGIHGIHDESMEGRLAPVTPIDDIAKVLEAAPDLAPAPAASTARKPLPGAVAPHVETDTPLDLFADPQEGI